jgi:hypothetical protein
LNSNSPSLFSGTIDISETEPHVHYEQVALSMEELKQEEDEEYRQLPDPDQFHGEPVPDDMDDDLFEIAAGLPLREKKRDNEPQQVEEEPLPNEEQIELDFCMQSKFHNLCFLCQKSLYNTQIIRI